MTAIRTNRVRRSRASQEPRKIELLNTEKGWDTRLLDDKGLHFEPVKLEDLNIDPLYQRPLRATKLSKMIEEFNPDELTAIVVSRRSDGTLWVLDGQHRVEVLSRLGKAVVLGDIREGLTREQEAFLFYRLNEGQTAVGAWDKFRARLASKEPVAVRINGITEEAGFRIILHSGSTADERHIAAVSSLERLYNIGKLKTTLEVIGAVWPHDKGAVQSYVLQGLGAFLFSFDGDPAFEVGQLLTSLDQVPVSSIVKRAKQLQVETGRAGQQGQMYGYAIRDAYNGHFHRGSRPKKQLYGQVRGLVAGSRAVNRG